MNPTSGLTGNLQTAISTSRYVRFGPFHVDLEQQELFRDGSRVRVQGKVCEALLILIGNAGEIVTRETLRARLWPSDTHINYEANVNTTVNKLRQVLGDSPEHPSFVETIPRKGYTFIANIEHADRPKFMDAHRTNTTEAAEPVGTVPSMKQFFRVAKDSTWFTAGLISLVIASMLFGAAIVLYAHRAV